MSNQLAFRVEGMTCASCVARVERALNKLPGVDQATVNLASGKASVVVDEGTTSAAALFDVVENAGYHPVARRLDIGVDGMTCAACVGRVERTIAKLPGVIEVGVNLTTEKASVTHLPEIVTAARIGEVIEAAGYEARVVVDDDAGEDRESAARAAETAGLRRDLFIAVVFTVPLFLIAMLRMVPDPGDVMLLLLAERGWMWAELVLATPVLFYAGRRFYVHGWVEFSHLNPGMNSLVMLGAGAAYFYSLLALLVPVAFPVPRKPFAS